MSFTRRRGLSAAAVLALVVGSVAIATPANALPGSWSPDPVLAPANGTVFTTSTVPLSWTAADGYSDYRLNYGSLGALTFNSVPVVGATATTLTLPDGAYSWYVGYKQPTKILYTDSPLHNFIVDTHGPAVNLVTPVASTVVAPGTAVTLSGLIVDPQFASATVSLDGTPIGDTLTSKIILRQIDTTGLASGLHTLTVNAVDSLAQSGSASITFTVDGTGPVATFTSPTNGQFVNPLSDTAVEATFDENADWSIWVDGLVQYGTYGNTVSWTLLADPTWANGVTRTITLEATDDLGNHSTTSVSVVADTKKPKLDFDKPTAGGVVGAFAELGGTAKDDSGISDVVVELHKFKASDGSCGALLETQPANHSGNKWSLTFNLSAATYTDGKYCFKAIATDAVGNQATEKLLPVILDKTLPTAFDLIDPHDWVLANGDFTWQPSTDANGVTYSVILTPECGCPTVLASGLTDPAYFEELEPGNYEWYVVATDGAGNERVSTSVFSLHVVGIPEIKKPDAGDLFSSHLHVKWKPVNAPGGVKKYVVEFANASDTFTKDVDGGTLELDQPFGNGRPDGDWTVRVKAVYWNLEPSLGTRQGEWSDPITVTRDTVAPGVPTLLTPEVDAVQASATVNYSWSAVADADHYLLRISPTPTVNGNGRLVDGSNHPVYAESSTETGALEGTYYWQVRAVDAAGNAGDWSAFRTFTIDYEYVAPAPPAPPAPSTTTKFFTLNTQSVTDDETVTEVVEETDEPEDTTDEPSTTGEEAEAAPVDEQIDPEPAGFPTGWAIVGIVIVILVGGGLLIRFIIRRAS